MSSACHILVVSDGFSSINLGGLQADLKEGLGGQSHPRKKES